jgi:hypothetical protein
MKNKKQRGVVAESVLLALIAAGIIFVGTAGVIATEALSITAGAIIGKVAANAEDKEKIRKIRDAKEAKSNTKKQAHK